MATGCSGTNAVRYGTAKGEWFLNAVRASITLLFHILFNLSSSADGRPTVWRRDQNPSKGSKIVRKRNGGLIPNFDIPPDLLDLT